VRRRVRRREMDVVTRSFKESEKEDREGSVCWFALPKGVVGNLSAGWVEVEPGGANVSLGHTEWRQVFFFVEGEGKLVLEGMGEVEVKSPMVVEIPYDVRHDAVASDKGPLKYPYVNDYGFKDSPRSH